MSKINIRKSWNTLSSQYQKKHKISTKHIHYGMNLPPESKLRLLGSLKGKHFLEIGCGGAQCSIAAAKNGAVVNSIDISDEQLKFAKKLAEENKVNIKFYRSSIENLKMIKSNSQDIVFSAYALQYIKNLNKCFKEAYRVLKKGGIFVFSLDHPFYDITNEKKDLKIIRSYFQTGYHEFSWGYKGSKVKVRSFVINRKVSDFVNTLIDSGFTIEKMLEPAPVKEDVTADFSEHYNYEVLKMVPSTIIFKARK